MSEPSRPLIIHIHVQHLLGSGHLVRMKTLASALARAGHRVTLISGGAANAPEDGIYRLFQLPAVHTAPGDFTTLLDADGIPVSTAFKARRVKQLLRRVAEDVPDVLVVETFPFGRRQLRFELIPLMRLVSRLNPRPLRLCSLRDILQLRPPRRQRQTVAAVHAWFDHVLVHADPTVATLADTFPLADQLRGRIFHSGYLHAPNNRGHRTTASAPKKTAQVVVSAGAGAVGLRLLRTAIAARPYSALRDRPWRILVGGNVAEADFAALAAQAGDAVLVERNRPDFADLLADCAVSVSQAGYNTVLDAVAANRPAVLVPFARYGETEQICRAEKFARLSRAVLLREEDLGPRWLAAAIDRAASLDLSECRPIEMDGAARTIRFIERCFRRCRAPAQAAAIDG